MTPKKRNGDITYKLTPEEQKYFSWVSMSPEQRRQNRNNRVKAYLSSAPSIGNFWEALQTYIGNRDPQNPHLNTGEAPSASRVINPKQVVQTVQTAGKVVDKAKRYITLTKESTKMQNYPKIGQRYSKSQDIMSDFNPISDLLHLRLPDFTHSSLGLGNKYRAIGGRKALKSVVENGVVAPKGQFSREGKVFWNDGFLDRTYSGRGIFALSYDKAGKAPFYPGGKPNGRYVYSLHENPIDFYDEALGLHARIPFTSTYVEIPKTQAGIDKALKLDKINRYVEKPVHKLYNWGLKPYLGYLGLNYFNSKEEELNKKEEQEKQKKQQYLDDYYSHYYKDGGQIRKMQTAAGGPIKAAKSAIDFTKKYYNSPGFNERFRNVTSNKIGFLNSQYNPTASYWEDEGWENHPKMSWNVKRTPLKIGKIQPIPEPNAKYDPDSGNILWGDSSTPQVTGMDWNTIMAHELGHALDQAIKVNNTDLGARLHENAGERGYTYSNLFPILRKSKPYQQIRNTMDAKEARNYDKYPNTYMGGLNLNSHDARPEENYADLFSMRKALYDLGIFDSTKSGQKFTKQHLDAFKKKSKNRLLDNFSDEDVIWMINNIASNSQKTDSFRVQAKKGGKLVLIPRK